MLECLPLMVGRHTRDGADVVTVMVVANEAHRTGAPLVAVETARACAEWGAVVSVVKRGDDLLPSFADVSDRVISRPAGWLEDWIPRLRHRGLPTGTRKVELGVARRRVREVQPDLVYAHTIETAEYVRAAHELGVRTVLHLHEPLAQVQRFVGPTGVGRRLTPDAVVGCSSSTSHDAAEFFGLEPHEVITLLEPVDVEDAQSRAQVEVPDIPGRPYVLTVGSMTGVKGVDLWLDTVADVVRRAESPPLFVWIGRGPRRRWLEDEIRRRRLGRHALVLGPRPNPVPYMAEASMLMLTSRHEGLPLVLLEALSVGTACVGFGVNGVPDAIGDDGTVVPPRDTRALAAAVLDLADDHHRLCQIAGSAPRRMQNVFGRRRFHEQTRELVASVVESQ